METPPRFAEPKSTLRDLINRHRLIALGFSAVCDVDAYTIISIMAGLKIHVSTAREILRGIHVQAGTQYALDDIDANCYYGSLSPNPVQRRRSSCHG